MGAEQAEDAPVRAGRERYAIDDVHVVADFRLGAMDEDDVPLGLAPVWAGGSP